MADEVAIVHAPPMRDTTRVIIVTIEDENGLADLTPFPSDQPRNARVLIASPIVLVWGAQTSQGENNSLVVVRRSTPRR